ncbi:MAG: protein kinase [Candidatus Hydrogenedentes bacterium]|nr:protein kinase [Candidatus Hydrogenedentota bacterium]
MTKIKCPVCEHTNDATRKDCMQCGAPLPKVRVHGSGPKPPSAPQPLGQSGGHSTFRKGQLVASRYTILDLVGKGGMGCIYRVHDNTLKEQVALKTLLPQYLRDKMVVERFFNEARIARQLSHPNIVRVHDIGMADQVLYISMEYLQGKSLRNMLEELLPGERLPVKDTVKIMIDLCTALEYAHQYTVHRDLKPENIMILPDGSLKLMDFGISKLMTTGKLTATAVVMGTPHYMPPEQFKDSSTVDARADIYSIGVILYEILTGNLPTGVPKPASQILRDVPPALDPIIAKCVEPEPFHRYATVAELKLALLGVMDLLRGGTIESKKIVKPPAAARGETLRRVAGGILVLVMIALTAIGVFGLEGRRARQLEEMNAQAVADPGESIERQWRQRYTTATELIVAAEQFTANREQTDEAVKRIFERIGTLRASAELNAERDPERAARLAHQALQCYAALLTPLPQGEYFFVVPGDDIDQDGFFMATHPVTVAQYSAWAPSANWPASASAATLDQPAVTSQYYDAQAYAANQGMRIPSRDEWERAFAEEPGPLATVFPEWTRTVTGGEPEADGLPTFGNELWVVTVSLDVDNNPTLPVFQSAQYYAPGQQISFRCVIPVNANPDAVRKLLGS